MKNYWKLALTLMAALVFHIVSGCGGGASVPVSGPTGSGTGTIDTGGPVIADVEASYPNSPALAASVSDLLNIINSNRSSELVWDGDIAQVAKNHCGRLIGDGVDRYVRIHLGVGPDGRLINGGVTFSVCDETGCDGLVNDLSAASAWAKLDQAVLANPAFNRIGVGLNAYSDA